ncbi:MAG: dihydropteroate synthase, partial [Hyphomicrobiales bacterium]|nr:dihydropteroate synthase [Hyphomicrobiales bacterium]
MSNALYLRPLGLLYGAAAQEATAAGRAAVLAGGRVAFSLLEVIEGRPGSARREVRSLPELKSSSDEAIASLLERLTH